VAQKVLKYIQIGRHSKTFMYLLRIRCRGSRYLIWICTYGFIVIIQLADADEIIDIYMLYKKVERLGEYEVRGVSHKNGYHYNRHSTSFSTIFQRT
jgi:hypothetical protein